MKALLITAVIATVAAVLGITYFDTTQISDTPSPNTAPHGTFEKESDSSHQPTYQDRLNSMGSEECEKVADNPSSYPPEIRKRCSQIFPSTTSKYVTNEELIQKLEETYLFTNRNFEDLYVKITDDMVTPEALKNCADLWNDMVQKTTSVNYNDMETVSPALESQSKFSSSYCYMTQDKWHK